MYVSVYCNEGMDSGLVYLLNERTFADQVADEREATIAEPDGYIPNCCGDLRVEFTDRVPHVIGERYQGSTCIWSGASFYFEGR
jgi:hypothetical protein